MNKLSAQEFAQIRTWMARNARPLELARWRYHFEGGSKADVLDCLSAYQNEDGGFGHALDADNWNPYSTPYNTGLAFDVLLELGIEDPELPLAKAAFDYLLSLDLLPDQGWPFTTPTNDDYPHAPWWTYSLASNEQDGYHATGRLVGYLLRCAPRHSPIYNKALGVAADMAQKLRRLGTLDFHEIAAYQAMLDGADRAVDAAHFDLPDLRRRVGELVNASIERDPLNWPRYSMRPSQYIDSPASPYYPGNEDVVQLEMDYILASRQTPGVWDISWQWADYPNEFAIARRWWQGFWAIRNVLLLRSFGRLDFSI